MVIGITYMKANKQKENSLTLEELKRQLDYNPLTGIFTWKISRYNNKPGYGIGSVAGFIRKNNYWQIKINRKIYQGHRLVWLYMTGEWPKYEIDHIDGNKSNNKFNNLRDISSKFNTQNTKKAYSTNKSGSKTTGVFYRKDRGSYVIKIFINGKQKYMGSRRKLEDAEDECIRLKKIHYPGFI